jgi:hypothetical protein
MPNIISRKLSNGQKGAISVINLKEKEILTEKDFARGVRSLMSIRYNDQELA